jgi:hypothetical protein
MIRPGDFHNAHIPTKRVWLEAIVRFAITELRVEALLGETEEAFKTHKTI